MTVKVMSAASSAACGGVKQRGGASHWERCLNLLKQKLSELTRQPSKELNFTVLSTVLSATGGPKVGRSFPSISSIGKVLHLAVWQNLEYIES